MKLAQQIAQEKYDREQAIESERLRLETVGSQQIKHRLHRNLNVKRECPAPKSSSTLWYGLGFAIVAYMVYRRFK